MITKSNLNLDDLGIIQRKNILHNLPVESLIEEILLNNEGVIILIDYGNNFFDYFKA